MFYFSELKGKPVLTEDRVKIGIVEDFIFLLAKTPLITKLVIRDIDTNKVIIPIRFLKKINSEITIEKNYLSTDLEANELHLVKNLLDQQIIDLKGNKIVRVNDVVVNDKDGFYLAGVDVGFLGILRWFRIEKFVNNFLGFFAMNLKQHFLSWANIQPLELARGHVKLNVKEEKLKSVRPEDLADYLEETNISNVNKLLKILDQKQAVEVVNNLNLNYQVALLKTYHPEKAAALLSLLDSDETVDILLTFSKKRRIQVLELFEEKKRKEIIQLLELSNTQIGGLITNEFITVSPDNLVREVIDIIKEEAVDFFSLYTIFVINKEKELIGVFNLHELLLQNFEIAVYQFMIQNVIVAHLTTPKEIVLKKMLKYRIQVLPVIDDKKRILGIIRLSDLIQ